MSDLHHDRLGPPKPDHDKGVQEVVARFRTALTSPPGQTMSDPAPEIVMGADGFYWRRFPGPPNPHDAPPGAWLSMPPVSDDNETLQAPVAVYRLVGWEDANGNLHSTRWAALHPDSRMFDGVMDAELELWLGDAFESWLPSSNGLVIRPRGGEREVHAGALLTRHPDGSIDVIDPRTSGADDE